MVDSNTSFGTAKLIDFVVGPSTETDVFEYNSPLVAGDGTPQSVRVDLDLTVVGALESTSISSDQNAVIDFERSGLVGVDFTGSSTDLSGNIIRAAENLLEGTVKNGNANTDALLIFYEASSEGPTQDAVIIRYQEGAVDASFDNELSVVAIFEGISSGSFDTVNIV